MKATHHKEHLPQWPAATRGTQSLSIFKELRITVLQLQLCVHNSLNEIFII